MDTLTIGTQSFNIPSHVYEVFMYETISDYSSYEELEAVIGHKYITDAQKEQILTMRVNDRITLKISTGNRGNVEIYEIRRGCARRNHVGIVCMFTETCGHCQSKIRKAAEEAAKKKAIIDAEIQRRRNTPEHRARRAARLAKKNR